MNEDVKREWVDALNSGKYPQGKESLLENGRYCCLGVLCDLAVKAGVIGKAQRATNGQYGFDGRLFYLPKSVIAWAGLESEDPRVVRTEDYKEKLSHLNDNGVPFSTIADLIKNQL